MTYCNVSEWSSTDLMSAYIDLTGEMHEAAARCRRVADRRAVVRDAIMDRFGLCFAMRFMARVERVLRT
jgi:hypothetical protein